MRCRDVDAAMRIFDAMPARDVVSWNSAIAGCVRNGLMGEALRLFDEMPERDAVSWNLVVSGFVGLGEVELAERVFEEITERDVACQTIMVSGLSSAGRVDDARMLFDEMPERDVVAWNTMLAGYIRNGRLEVAKGLFVKMPNRDLDSWIEMIEGLVTGGQLVDALRLRTWMPDRSLFAWNSILPGLVRSGLVEQAHALFEKCLCRDIVSYTNLVVGYFELGNVMDGALKLFRLMPCLDVTSWNATIHGLWRNDFGEEGLKLFLEMNSRGFDPDMATFTTILNICSNLPSLEFGKQVHCIVNKTGFDRSVAVCNAAVSMYSRCGSIQEAFDVFSWMAVRDRISWNSIICGLSCHGKGREAVDMFEGMRAANVMPDEITFVGVLSACSHSGLVQEGQYYFGLMESELAIKPSVEHFTCVVDLLGRFGFVEEAMVLVNRMERDGVGVSGSVWGAILGACRIHGKVDIGELAGGRILEMEPWNACSYLMMAELYLSGGRRGDCERVLALMKQRGVKKEPGCSWIGVKGNVHVFLAGDGSHPEITEVCLMLCLLDSEI